MAQHMSNANQWFQEASKVYDEAAENWLWTIRVGKLDEAWLYEASMKRLDELLHERRFEV